MIGRTTRASRELLPCLPVEVRRRAHDAYARFRDDPQHPGVRFKKVHATQPIYSVRVDLEYRAVGIMDGEVIVWFWIGSHADYDELLKRI